MKKFPAILSSIILVVLSACANSQVDKTAMAIGEVSQQQLMSEHKSFQQSYQTFQLSDNEIAEIKGWPNDLHIEVYFGSWCHDSQREVPRFFKMVAESPTLSNRLIGLDYEKSEPNGSAKKHDIKYTPTFIVYQGDKEIGRIIERPNVSLTADISAML
ncbi:thioredoxin family protein [Colwellia sp. BRX10-3]|uniref:thioredoxin family protein n=1 Tax=Colwellia sp. BRX10-3 TaxID=2759844 RepID=UPI0015F44E8E|nr:thioredoxin family protein [Colwellia sp. BRX10-3]MBA6389574.1 thioredoxin family protein [Colwellia sp. BRX10-3]